jgi:hypothetical protein
VRNDSIVLFDVEGDQPFQVREGVELMQVEPAVFQGTPPCFDHGIGKADLDLGENAPKLSETEKVVDLVVDILAARVGDDGGPSPPLGRFFAASIRTWHVVCGSRRRTSFQARIRLLKLSITACR